MIPIRRLFQEEEASLFYQLERLMLLPQNLTNQSHSIERVALPYAIAGFPVNTQCLLIIVQRLSMLSLEHFWTLENRSSLRD